MSSNLGKLAVVDAPAFESEWIVQNYIVVGRDEVLEFVTQHPFLVPLLKAIPGQLKTYFSDARLYLEVSYDPEIPDYEKLVVFISPDAYAPEQAFDLFKQFKYGWWLATSQQTQNMLHVMLGYR